MKISLTSSQKKALDLLQGSENVFLTGAAGTGKSFLLNHYRQASGRSDPALFPILASTGAAAVMMNGRTFHSFFGLGILQGGVQATVERGLENKKLLKRLKKAKEVTIDEISMIPGSAFRAAETLARMGRESDEPWGGLRVICLGDFTQLPPVSQYSEEKDWCFKDIAWVQTRFQPVVLNEIVRSSEKAFIQILNDVRMGNFSGAVRKFLEDRKSASGPLLRSAHATRLFPHRATTQDYNERKLRDLPGKVLSFPTVYEGRKEAVDSIKRAAPIPERLDLKFGAWVMIRQNDPLGRWYNGSVGTLENFTAQGMQILLKTGETVKVERATFTLLDAEGKKIAEATNFPLQLAWASTIHKAQGLTLDEVCVDISQIWEPGQAYVALSRVRKSHGLGISGWSAEGIKIDPDVQAFCEQIGAFK